MSRGLANYAANNVNLSESQFADPARKQWRQGWWGDLCFRVRLFLAPERVVEILNDVEGAQSSIEVAKEPIPAFAVGALQVSTEYVLDVANDQLARARFSLRELVFGVDAAAPRFDGPEQCAAFIDCDPRLPTRRML